MWPLPNFFPNSNFLKTFFEVTRDINKQFCEEKPLFEFFLSSYMTVAYCTILYIYDDDGEVITVFTYNLVAVYTVSDP